jgi:hypothetical protein
MVINGKEIEVMDIIHNRLSTTEMDLTPTECFMLGNVIKYVLRALHKDNKIDDLKKAKNYIDYIIKENCYNENDR